MAVHIVDHPLVQDALLELRNVRTPSSSFRNAARRISVLLAAEALRDLPTASTQVETPLAPATGRSLGTEIVVVPVLRAGLGMLDAVLELVPNASVGFVGLHRDEQTAVSSQYYQNLPEKVRESLVLLIDPMLATGGSALRALDVLAEAGATAPRFVCIVAAPEGIDAVTRHAPSAEIYTAAVDDCLDEHSYIVPGLGDFGDRLYSS